MADRKYDVMLYTTNGARFIGKVDDAFFMGNGAIFCYQVDNQRFYHSTANIESVTVTLLEGEWEEDGA